MPAIGATTISSLIAGNVRFKEAAKPPSTAEMRRVPVRLLVGRKEPGWLNFCPFRQSECILDVDAKIAHRVLDLGVAE